MTLVKRRKVWRMRCDVREVTERSFSNLSVTSRTSQLILQSFRRFTCVISHSPTLPLFHLRHFSFSNVFVALSTSDLILQPFRYFTYVIAHSPTLLSLLLRHRLFTYVTWRAAHASIISGISAVTLLTSFNHGRKTQHFDHAYTECS